jgi:hypothetical protein
VFNHQTDFAPQHVAMHIPQASQVQFVNEIVMNLPFDGIEFTLFLDARIPKSLSQRIHDFRPFS